MKKTTIVFVLTAIILSVCGCNDNNAQEETPTQHEWTDKQNMLESIYSIADEFGMKVICDLNVGGGGLYPGDPGYIAALAGISTEAFAQAFGHHPSFWGWYLNNEINPLRESDAEQTRFWRTLWKDLTAKCHKVAPGSKVTIAPFFILDKYGKRNVWPYYEPEEYAAWWEKTLKETGIDVLMLQDSGAEHLSIFTLTDREPFFKATADACAAAGAEFWVDLESAQVFCKDWDEAVSMERGGTKDWRYVGLGWLKEKLNLAAKYGTNIVNWGYYPVMNPLAKNSGLTATSIDGYPVNLSEANANYASYKEYVEDLPETVPAGLKCIPKMSGTLWWLVPNSKNLAVDELYNAIRREIRGQRNAGMEYIWIVNAYGSFSVVK
ncbi:MAG: DUF4434 domain-containing protein [Bacteroidales bacterium]|nr:DUF4434 domain-containing protein [Bacteroidales bacterium]